ncbi:OB-fold protein [Fimbriiglobus ruber]|uniref:OB-fold protein n=1 Tax=Fimbriiglobus ruber TaxID=1908690 RepID=UPI00137A7ED6|nr:hypothetical protein [Fimbriiglobus ruber]
MRKFLLLVALAGCQAADEQPTARRSLPSGSEQAQIARLTNAAEEQTTAYGLLFAFKWDATSANKKYKNKIVTVSGGEVDHIDRTASGKGHVALYVGPEPTDLIHCYFERGDLDLEPGQFVFLSGRCRGLMAGTVVLDSCEIGLVADTPEELCQKSIATRK